MNITEGIEIVDLGLYLKKQKTLIVSDLHIGYEEALNKQGYLVPIFQFEDIFERLKKIIEKVFPKRIIINGDLKHEFGTISHQEWNGVLRLLDFLKDMEIILVKGNHDNILGPIVDKRNIKVVERYDIDDISIIHGNKIIENTNKIIIIGHEHPTISFKERPDEKYKCFLKGKWKSQDLIVIPSLLSIPGTDIKREKLLSPYLQQNLEDFEVFVVEDKVYKFGKLRNLK